MTPTPPVQEMTTTEGQIMYCVREMRRHGAESPAIQAWADYLEDRIVPAITTERLARQQAERERDQLRSALVGLVGSDGREELDAMEAMMRLMPAPDADKAVTINAIHALIGTLKVTP